MNEDALLSHGLPVESGRLILKINDQPVPIDEDLQIIAAVRDGDSEAFGALVKKYEDFVFTLARGIVQSDDLARDITQEVFLRTYRSIRRFEQKSNFKTWLYRIAYNTSLSQLAKQKTACSRCCNVSEDMVEKNETDYGLRRSIHILVNRLKPELKAVIMFHYYENLKYEEIAEILKCPIGTVKIRLFRAKHELKKLWDKYAI